MTTNIVDDILLFLNTYAQGKNYCSVNLNWLEPKGVSCCVAPSETGITQKEYINGAKVRTLAFSIIAQGLEKDSADICKMLVDYATLFDDMTDISLGNRVVNNATATFPRLTSRNANMQVMFSTSITINYKE